MYAPTIGRGRYWVVCQTGPKVIGEVYGVKDSLEAAKELARGVAQHEDLDITILKELGDERPL